MLLCMYTIEKSTIISLHYCYIIYIYILLLYTFILLMFNKQVLCTFFFDSSGHERNSLDINNFGSLHK